MALEEAQALGLLTSEAAGRAIAFDHPLTRAAVYHALGPAQACGAACGRRGAGWPSRASRCGTAPLRRPGPILRSPLSWRRSRRSEVLRNAWESAAASTTSPPPG